MTLDLSHVQGARAKMEKCFDIIILQNNGYFTTVFWYHLRALCIHFQKLALVFPFCPTWRSAEEITGAASNFSEPFFASDQIIDRKHSQDDCFGSCFQSNSIQ